MWIRFRPDPVRGAFSSASWSRAAARARMRTAVVGRAIGVRDLARFRASQPSLVAPCRQAGQVMSLAPTSRQVHEMQSGLNKFAFAIARPAGYQGDAFQASSPKNFPGRFWRPPFFA